MNSSSREIEIDLSGDSPKKFADTSSQNERLRSPDGQIKRGKKRLTGGRSPLKHDEITLLVQPSDDTTAHGRCEATEKQPKKRKTKSASGISHSTDLSNSMDIQKNHVPCKKSAASSSSRQLVEPSGLDSIAEVVIERPNIAVTSRKKSSCVKQKKVKLAVSMIIDPSFDAADSEYRLSVEFAVLEYSNFTVSEETSIPGLVRWSKTCAAVSGSNKGNSETTYMNFVCVVFDPFEFISLSRQGDQSLLTFEALGDKMRELTSIISAECPLDIKLSLILIDLEGAVNKQIKKEKKNPPAGRCTKNISALLESASVFLLLEKGVNITKHSNIAETAEYLASVTVQLLLLESTAGQEFLMKKSTNPTAEVKSTMTPTELLSFKRRKMWINMLVTVPGVSEVRAKEVAKIYTCPQELLSAYYDASTTKDHKINLLTNLFSDSETISCNRPNLDKRISLRVYEIFTSLDPLTVFDEDQPISCSSSSQSIDFFAPRLK